MKFYCVDSKEISSITNGVEWFTNRTVALAAARQTTRAYKTFLSEYKTWEKKLIQESRQEENQEYPEGVSPEILEVMPVADFKTCGGTVRVVECLTNDQLTSKSVLLCALNQDPETWETKETIWSKQV